MTTVTDAPDHATDSGTLDRRSMIKRAAAAGALAWTAPMIIDSLASPAAAATIDPGDYLFVFNIFPGTTCSDPVLKGDSSCSTASFTGSCLGGPFTRVETNGVGAPMVDWTLVCNTTPGDQGICWSTNVGTFTITGLGLGSCTAPTTGYCITTSGCYTAPFTHPGDPTFIQNPSPGAPLADLTVALVVHVP